MQGTTYFEKVPRGVLQLTLFLIPPEDFDIICNSNNGFKLLYGGLDFIVLKTIMIKLIQY